MLGTDHLKPRDLWTYGVCAMLTAFACWLAIDLTTPMPIYAFISGVLGALLVIGWRRAYRPFWYVMAGMLWYASFWSVRDSIAGFYAPQTYLENWASLFPVMVALLFYAEKLNWRWVAAVVVVHSVAVYFMNDTDNEVLALLTLVAFGQRQRSIYERAVLVSFFWYQCYIATTKYMTEYYVDRDVIYFIALAPYLTALIFKYVSRITRHDV